MTSASIRRSPVALTLAILTVVLASVSAASPQPPPDTLQAPPPCDDIHPADLKRICRSGRLAVSRYDGQRPPFFFETAEGEWDGFDVDIARDIAARLDVEYQTVLATSFNEVVAKVADRSADIGISKLSATLERSKKVRFTHPYMTVYQTLLVNRLAAPKQQDPYRFLNRPEVRLGAREWHSNVSVT